MVLSVHAITTCTRLHVALAHHRLVHPLSITGLIIGLIIEVDNLWHL